MSTRVRIPKWWYDSEDEEEEQQEDTIAELKVNQKETSSDEEDESLIPLKYENKSWDCAQCGGLYSEEDVWIQCDACDDWF